MNVKIGSKKLVLLNIISFFIVLLTFLFLSIALPKEEFSQDEGRELAQRPTMSLSSYVSGSFSTEYEAYYNDNFPFRNSFVRASAYIKEMYGFRQDDVKIHIGTGNTTKPDETPQPDNNNAIDTPIGNSSANNENETKPVVDETEVDKSDFADISNINDVGVANNGVFTLAGTGMTIYGGNKTTITRYADVISSYAKMLEGKAQVHNLIVPTSIEFYLPEKYENISGDQLSDINTIKEALDPNVTWIDAYSELEKHTDDQIYFATDHHWTALGAYYAYVAFCETKELTPVPLGEFEAKTRPPFVGSLFRYTQDVKLKDNPDNFTYYVPKTEASAVVYKKGARDVAVEHKVFYDIASDSNTYSLFLGGDYPLVEITTKANTGRSIIMVKESFGNAFAPFLINHYDKVYVVDQRYFEKDFDKFVIDNEIDDVLFINNLTAAATGVHIDWINNLQYGKAVYVPPAEPVQPVQPTEPTAPDTTEQIPTVELPTIIG